jgi:hypothetical protein
MANARDAAQTSTSTQPQPGSTAGSGGTLVASWFRAHPKIDNAAFEGLRKLQAPQRDEILQAIQQQHGNAFVQAGLAGKLPESESAAADRDFANAHGNTATLAADLGTSRATDAYDTELMTRMVHRTSRRKPRSITSIARSTSHSSATTIPASGSSRACFRRCRRPGR